MTWIYSLLTAALSGVAGLFLAGFIANACVSWYHISSREGGSGYFVMFLGIGGGMAGFIIGFIAARMVASHYGPGFGTLREKCGGDFTPELKTILELSRARPDSHCMRADICRVASFYLHEWTGLAPLPTDPKPR